MSKKYSFRSFIIPVVAAAGSHWVASDAPSGVAGKSEGAWASLRLTCCQGWQKDHTPSPGVVAAAVVGGASAAWRSGWGALRMKTSCELESPGSVGTDSSVGDSL